MGHIYMENKLNVVIVIVDVIIIITCYTNKCVTCLLHVFYI